MDFNSTIDLIIKDLQEARDIVDDLKKYPGVPLLQVELAKSKCKSAAEIIALLKSTREINVPETEEPAKPAFEKKSLKEEKIIPETDTDDASTDIKEVEVHNVEIIQEREVISTTANLKSNTDKIAGVKEKKIVAVWKDDPGIIKEVPGISKEDSGIIKEVPGINKEDPGIIKKDSGINKEEIVQISISSIKESPKNIIEKKTTIIADRFIHEDDDSPGLHNAKRVKKLSDAIGINDSFLFIREIFNGDKATYNEAIMKLENAESVKDAKAVIMSYTGTNNENEAIDQLLYLVRRKLLLHE